MRSRNRWITISPPFDKRHADPNKNYGVGSAVVGFYLGDQQGVVQFVMLTGWYQAHVRSEWVSGGHHTDSGMGCDLGYHSPTPTYEGQTERPDCPFLDGAPCYYDGSSLAAQEVFLSFLSCGEEGVWGHLERYYSSRFDREPPE